MANRTDELRNRGARDRTGEQYPFISWPGSKNDPMGEYSYAFLEGRVERLWTGTYGLVATLTVTGVSAGLRGVIGSGDDRQETDIAVGETVNVGLKLAALAGTISEKDVGTEFHIAFSGWGESKGGDRFRQFAVLEVPSEDGRGQTDRVVTYAEAKDLLAYAAAICGDDAAGELRKAIALVQKIEPENVTFAKVAVGEVEKIKTHLKSKPTMGDDLPF